MTLHTIKPSPGSRKRKLRVGRGLARRGAMSGRGTKGQRARSGGKSGLKVKGLRQTLLRIPKSRGFKSPVVKAATVSLRDVNDVSLKILGTGALTKALTVKGCQVTQSAKKQIEAAGGTIAS